MMHNVCSRTERIIRALMGIALLGLLFMLPNPIGYLGLVGVVLVASAAMRYCPISHLLGVNTCKMKETHS
ncbi:Protein of unknown function [Geoalkalibacter ferrihydriticus]|uniref:Inner membrane protein YgaP-like transmembrane domain-containing protein n=2 Tax=Geoalkalibacter ferrihydriticus TaxID=392333 RepID=A0A0C2EBU7_9BACT|nr:DUF2892 domain-containing protein [Geoalkalibacter ferrihydriticus]KIH76048.1 hypothetical protein GFER_12360 [Geoalkalibacter ferrihydriticus DSM 17813]SDM48095.1 Protein of unknown function [Geoalkalibacter ferrihydriticus]